MKKTIVVMGGSLIIGLLVLMSLVQVFAAHPAVKNASAHGIALPKSPYSTGYLVAQAVHQGKIHPAQFKGKVSANPNPNLTCSPAPCALPNSLASNDGGQPVNEDPIAVNPTRQQNLLTGGNDYNCPTIQGFFTSNNGGTTWNSTCLNPLPGAFGEGDPGVGYDMTNNAFISGIDGGTADGSDIVFERSRDNGKHWTAPAIAVRPLFAGGLTDKDWLQVDDNATSPYKNFVYISVTQFATNNDSTISVSHSGNHGASWQTVAIDSTQTFPTVDQFSDLAIGRDGTVYASWMRCVANGPTGDCGGTTATFYMALSHNHGLTWSTPKAIASANLAPDTCGAFYGCLPNTFERVSNIPAIDVNRFGGGNLNHLYTTFYNYNGTNLEVMVTTSRDHGNTWSTPVSVSNGAINDEFFPWLTVSGRGIVGVSWLDRRNDPTNVSYEAFAATSSDDGNSFSTNIQVASVPSNPNNDGFGGGFMGDYTGNYWFHDDRLYVSWMDTRNGVDAQDEVGGIQVP